MGMQRSRTGCGWRVLVVASRPIIGKVVDIGTRLCDPPDVGSYAKTRAWDVWKLIAVRALCQREWIRMACMSVEYVPAPIVQLRRALFLTFPTVAFFAPATPAPAQQALDPMQAPGLATPSSQDAHAIA